MLLADAHPAGEIRTWIDPLVDPSPEAQKLDVTIEYSGNDAPRPRLLKIPEAVLRYPAASSKVYKTKRLRPRDSSL
jgi:hypothetical protein